MIFWDNNNSLKKEEYKKLKKKFEGQIENIKCQYCCNGIVVYRTNSDVYRFHCDDYLRWSMCERRNGLIFSIFGEKYISLGEKDIPDYEFFKKYNFTENLLITGPINSGKTTMLLFLFLKAKLFQFEVSIREPKKILKDYANRKEDYKYIFTSQILLIDNLNKKIDEDRYSLFQNILEEIINFRWSNNKITIIATRLEEEEFKKYYDFVYKKLNFIVLKLKPLEILRKEA